MTESGNNHIHWEPAPRLGFRDVFPLFPVFPLIAGRLAAGVMRFCPSLAAHPLCGKGFEGTSRPCPSRWRGTWSRKAQAPRSGRFPRKVRSRSRSPSRQAAFSPPPGLAISRHKCGANRSVMAGPGARLLTHPHHGQPKKKTPKLAHVKIWLTVRSCSQVSHRFTPPPHREGGHQDGCSAQAWQSAPRSAGNLRSGCPGP